MPNDPPGFDEASPGSRAIRDLGLAIAGSALEPILEEFEAERLKAGLRRVRPRYYLSTEWGVPEGTVAIAIPFYLATPELTALHEERVGHVEGASRADILRYLRHELGHAVNYAYRLFDDPGWRDAFGAMSAPYREEFPVEPFSRRYVRHLPGWYAQKHPDEDWAETFAVWMTPGLDWRAEYAEWPAALAKLQYCDRTLAALSDRDPPVTADDLDEDVAELTDSLDQFYGAGPSSPEEFPPGLGGALRAALDDLGPPDAGPRGPASRLIRRWERPLAADVYRWTGHFPERTRALLDHLAAHADRAGLTYPEDRHQEAMLALACLVTALAMNHIQKGVYLP
jgi:hypothetical protein